MLQSSYIISKYLAHEAAQKGGPPLLRGQAEGPGVVQSGEDSRDILSQPPSTLRRLVKKSERLFTQTDSNRTRRGGF